MMMRTAATLISLAANLVQAADLSVTITGIREPEGHLLVAVVDSATAWDEQGEPVARRRVPADGERISLEIPDLPAGDYAIQVAHDENDNGGLDFNLLGIPTEGYGFSNNPDVRRRPTFDEARFTLGADGASIVVELR